MRRIQRWFVLPALVMAAICGSREGLAQERDFHFNLDLGYRWLVNFRGSEDLYRSQIDLGEGPKLFAADLSFAVPPTQSRFFDRIEASLNSWGGEPYNTAQFLVVKDGIYELDFDYQNVRYFNSIPRFANPFFEQGVLDSQHRFDIEQRSFGLHLTLLPGRRISPYLGYRRDSRDGPIRTTLAADGDEFLISGDADSHSQDLRGGVRFRFSSFSLALEQGFRWFNDTTLYTAEGFQEGNSDRDLLGRPITLDRYRGQTDVRAFIPFSTAQAAWEPHSTLTVRGRLSYGIADLDSDFSDQISGNFFAFPPEAIVYARRDQFVTGRAKRPSLYVDVTANWKPVARFQLIERFYSRRHHVSGSAFSRSVFGDVEEILENRFSDQIERQQTLNTFLAADLDTQELLALFSITPRFVLRGGHRYQHRRVESNGIFSWNRHVLIAGGSYQFSTRNRVSAEYEFGDSDRPIQRTDPVDFHRLRLRGRFSPFAKLEFNGSVSLFDHDDALETIDLTSRSRNYTAQFTFTPASDVSFSGSYERSDFRHEILFLVPQTLTEDRSFYREKGDYADLYINFPLLDRAQISLGYSVWGTVGNFPITYHRPLARVEVEIDERIHWYFRWNYYDYNEKFQQFPQNYRTHMAVTGVRIGLDSLFPPD